jgi:hypothetical protein
MGLCSQSKTEIDVSSVTLMYKFMSIFATLFSLHRGYRKTLCCCPTVCHAFWGLSLMRSTDQTPHMSLFLTGSLLFLFDSVFFFSVHVRKSWRYSHRLETNGWRIFCLTTKTYFQQFNFKGRTDVLRFISDKFSKPIDKSLRRSSFELKFFVL